MAAVGEPAEAPDDRSADDGDALVAAAAGGDEDALVALYRDLHPRLCRYLAHLVPDEAEDLASETWVALVGRFGSVTGGVAGVRRLAFTIARRRAIDLRRRRARRRTDPAPTAVLAARPTAARVDPAVVAVDDLSARDAVALLVDHLPAEWAEVVLLRVVGGLSAVEVGRLTGRSPGAVRVLQHRAVARLAERLDHGDGTIQAKA